MALRVEWTPEAERWLKAIHDYIGEDSPAAARRVAEDIYERAKVLADYPGIGYRRIAYWAREKDVVILGVFHGSMDLKRWLVVP
jgi:plasmid stabilization system protein ParE